ncbi:MAG: ester cyclase [Lysobacterales bacterium]
MTPNQWIEQWFQKLWNEGQPSAITQMVAADGVLSGLPGGPFRGHDALMAHYESMSAVFGEFDVEINEAMEWGDEGMARFNLNMTHTGSGHRVGLECACWYRLRNGLLVEGRNYIDFLALLQQLGMSSKDAFQAAVS